MLNRGSEAITEAAPLLLRLSAGLLWLSNVSWKTPPDFGETGERCRGLCRFVQAGIDHPVAPGWSWMLEEVVRPNLELFGWVVLLVEFLLAALLLSGTLTRLAAAVGFGQSVAIGLTVANAPGEWYWSYALMAALHLAVFATAAGQRAPGRTAVAAVTGVYGVLLVVANARNDVLTSDFTREWVLFGSRTDFPGGFGRNVFAGTVALGVLSVVLAAVTWFSAGRPVARWPAVLAGLFALVLVVAYRDDGNVLAAKPSAAAVMLAIGLYLAGTSGGVLRRRLGSRPGSQGRRWWP